MKNLLRVLGIIGLLVTLNAFTMSYRGKNYDKAIFEFLMFAWIYRVNYKEEV